MDGSVAQPFATILYEYTTGVNKHLGSNIPLPPAPFSVAQPDAGSVAPPVLYETACPASVWQPWVTRCYPECIGPGVVAGFWVFRSKKDGNRGLYGEIPRDGREMQQRLDLILLRSDGKLVALHIGTTQRSSAKPAVEDAIAFKR